MKVCLTQYCFSVITETEIVGVPNKYVVIKIFQSKYFYCQQIPGYFFVLFFTSILTDNVFCARLNEMLGVDA